MATHRLSLLHSVPYPSLSFICNLCNEPGCGPVYHCPHCTFDLHVSCAAMTLLHTHFTHPDHPLHLTPAGSRPRLCDSCGLNIRAWSFRCDPCDFDLHSVCARAPRFVLHHSHPHPLELRKRATADNGGEKAAQCNGCGQVVADYIYECDRCHFFLHQACATLPDKSKHAKHRAHSLKLKIRCSSRRDNVHAVCKGCGEPVKGWGFRCTACDFNLHPICADLVHELPHESLMPEETSRATMATTSADIHVAHDVVGSSRPPSAPRVLDSLHRVEMPKTQDWEAMKRVLQFAEEMMKSTTLHVEEGTVSNCVDNQQEHCPTCFEGYDSTNPRTVTSCGHSFHMACILEWMERSDHCPICRRHCEIKM